jgi:hypothetical protein
VRSGRWQANIKDAVDYGAEIHRSWRRVLEPLWMPEGQRSREARVKCDPMMKSFASMPVSTGEGAVDVEGEIASIITRFDWHSQVTVHLAAGAGGAAWARSKRTITVNAAYVQRFVDQGQRVK